MYSYHESSLRPGRLAKGECRCASDDEGRVWNLAELLADGRIEDPRSKGTPLNSPAIPRVAGRGADGKPFIYAIREQTVRIAVDGDRPQQGSVKHETLFHNLDVEAAGEIEFHDGSVGWMNDHSGSYGTHGLLQVTPEYATVILRTMSFHGIPVAPAFLAFLEQIRG